ncbi:hypothetical protein RHMOL_Rhmol11G0087300 [Rhododendron molle]|uniref:Uncharacterized protein n=1 Tax=Rhododendron molle TaxID=49168 RepID=A0ACC0LQF0_RHOML|nr:hypothetical protein RHMOL_Rhmol11G0087300 [Rhododendron molle]
MRPPTLPCIPFAKTDRMAARLREIKAENNLYDEECQSNMATVGDIQNGVKSLQDKSNIVGDPSDVEVNTHATGFHEIIMQESGNVIEWNDAFEI